MSHPTGTSPPNVLRLDPRDEVRKITEILRRQVGEELGRRGVVLGLSGGVDSSVCAALAVEAFGPERVLPLLMPERESDPASLELGRKVADGLGLEPLVEDVTGILEAVGCYRRRDEAVRRLVPEFGEGWGLKLALPRGRMRPGKLMLHRLVVKPPGGVPECHRLPPTEYREIVAATSFKQRVRKMMEYHHADRLHRAVLGTPNRLEFDQGFFVKGGDGLADVKPIAHLYKSQVYQLARHFDLPREILERPPTTDTFSLPQGQDEFYFAVPLGDLDLLLYAHDSDVDPSEAARWMGRSSDEVRHVFRTIEQKRRTTRYLHLPALLTEQEGGDPSAGQPRQGGA